MIQGGGWNYQIKYKGLFYLFSQKATDIQVSPDWYSFMTGILSYSSQLTQVYLLHMEKGGKLSSPLYLKLHCQPPPY